uniref:Uncharacterized protein n=1 Tax=Siphoviridae sp. ctOba29 TaxID=2825480 RepID=A0A8S5NVX4_9CAUD|nr:MAG TPA: hypothetical protein [Siphoviridae sp. ctOba29]
MILFRSLYEIMGFKTLPYIKTTRNWVVYGLCNPKQIQYTIKCKEGQQHFC